MNTNCFFHEIVTDDSTLIDDFLRKNDIHFRVLDDSDILLYDEIKLDEADTDKLVDELNYRDDFNFFDLYILYLENCKEGMPFFGPYD